MPTNKTAFVAFRIKPSLSEKLKALAEEKDMHSSEFCRQIITEYLEKRV